MGKIKREILKQGCSLFGFNIPFIKNAAFIACIRKLGPTRKILQAGKKTAQTANSATY